MRSADDVTRSVTEFVPDSAQCSAVNTVRAVRAQARQDVRECGARKCALALACA